MVSLNYDYLEKLIAESMMDQKELAADIGLPEKFFTRLKSDGSNLNVGEFCRVVDYFGVDVDELLTAESNENARAKMFKGRQFFEQYYKYEEKTHTMPPPEADAYTSSWVSDVSSNKNYTKSPEQFYVEQKNDYKRTFEIFETMENVLTSTVCSATCPVPDKEMLRKRLIEYMVYGTRPKLTGISQRKIISLANKACVSLIDELEYKKLI